jgi:hypothetical protein
MQEGQLFALMCNLEAIAPFRLLAIMGLRKPRAKNAKAFDIKHCISRKLLINNLLCIRAPPA